MLCRVTLFRTTGLLIGLLFLGFAGWLSYDSLNEAFGSGPPFYGRTVNMDKWHNPIPGLLMIDGLAVLMCAAAVQMYRRRSSERQALEQVPAPSADVDDYDEELPD
jgi:hypothetical protein